MRMWLDCDALLEPRGLEPLLHMHFQNVEHAPQIVRCLGACSA